MSATYRKAFSTVTRVAAVALASGAVLQDFDGLAGVVAGLNAVAAGSVYELQKDGVVELAKASDINLLAGGRAFYDRANAVVTFKPVTGGFYLGTVVEDSLASATTVLVALNRRQHNRIEWGKGIWDCVAIKTAGTVIPNLAAGLSGTDPGGSNTRFTFSATAEAQKADALSRDVVAIADGPILEARLAIYDIGDDAALDINIGLANATHATDADSITESVFFHLDGSSLNINAESDDGTTEVAATDTTVDAVDDTYFEVWIDARDPADVQLYVDAVNVLPDSTFKLNAGTGPLKALFHIEKTANDTVADVRVEFLNVRSTDLAA
jgi:predicted RecA/RadA family phage recombinase